MSEIRTEIDRIDREVISLLGERYEFVKAASQFKKSPDQVKAQSRFDAMLKERRAWAEEQGVKLGPYRKKFIGILLPGLFQKK